MRFLTIGLGNALVYLGVLAVLIVVIFVHLPGVVGRVTDNHADLAAILALDPRNVFFADRAKQVVHVANGFP